uniref:Chromosome 5 open reading frame 45 n=1 Tax=Nothobranchius rachovii TaxID=451742 RepID=A0A1A8PJ44_9TELE
MVQEFHVVRCFSCESFQVQQVKKVNRWSCKLCGQKQSLLKEFGRGSGADCRRHVQKLNALRGAQVEEQEQKTLFPWEQEEVKEAQEEEQKDEHVKLVSRWSRYLDTPGEDDSREHETRNKVVMKSLHGNIRSNRKRQRSGECTDETQEPYCTPAQPACPPGTPPALPGPSTASRWDCFLRDDRQDEEDEAFVCGQSQTDAVASQLCSSITTTRPHIPVLSMFESGEDFSCDDDNFLKF